MLKYEIVKRLQQNREQTHVCDRYSGKNGLCRQDCTAALEAGWKKGMTKCNIEEGIEWQTWGPSDSVVCYSSQEDLWRALHGDELDQVECFDELNRCELWQICCQLRMDACEE